MLGCGRHLLTAAGTLLVLGLTPAAAQPHVWLTNVTTFVFQDQHLAAVRLTWIFDDAFGSALIRRFDADGDGAFDLNEAARLEADAFASLKAYRYFTHILLDGREIAIERAENFRPAIRHGRLVYDFAVPLPQPVDPAAVDVIVTVYDETHFVEAALDAADPVRFEGMPPGRCAYAIRESPGSGEVAPYQLVSLTCRAP